MSKPVTLFDQSSEPPRASSGSKPDYILRVDHSLEAPRHLVWKVLTSQYYYLNSYEDRGFRLIEPEFDIREGGSYRFGLLSLGMEVWFQGTYLSFQEPECFVFTSTWQNADGKHENETRTTVTLREDAGKTMVSVEQGPLNSMSAHDLYEEYWTYSLHMLTKFCDDPRKLERVLSS